MLFFENTPKEGDTVARNISKCAFCSVLFCSVLLISLFYLISRQIETGRTSAVVQHTVFERPDGSGRRLTLVDLAGHEKYLRTTLYGFNR